jgi:hypothetical protein
LQSLTTRRIVGLLPLGGSGQSKEVEVATRTKTPANGQVEDSKAVVEKGRRGIVLPKHDAQRVTIRIEGLEPLITCRFAEKARQEIAAKQQGRAATRKAPKDPEALYAASFYVVPGMEKEPEGTPGKYFMPGGNFKQCAVNGCRYAGKDVPMTRARGAFFVIGNPVIEFESIEMREDYVRNETGWIKS